MSKPIYVLGTGLSHDGSLNLPCGVVRVDYLVNPYPSHRSGVSDEWRIEPADGVSLTGSRVPTGESRVITDCGSECLTP